MMFSAGNKVVYAGAGRIRITFTRAINYLNSSSGIQITSRFVNCSTFRKLGNFPKTSLKDFQRFLCKSYLGRIKLPPGVGHQLRFLWNHQALS